MNERSHWICRAIGHRFEFIYESRTFGIFLCTRCGRGFTLKTKIIAQNIEAEEKGPIGGVK